MTKPFFVLILSVLTTWAHAQTLPAGSFAVVNGQAMSNILLDLNVQANVARGQPDTVQLRQALQSELIAREVLAQEAQKLKLDQIPQNKVALEQVQQEFLMRLLLDRYTQANPVTDAQIKLEYEAFKHDMKDAKQYKLSIITVATQKRAQELIAQLQKNPSKSNFNAIAQSESIDASKSKGGELDWLLVQQMLPMVSNVVVNLSKGALTNAPIQTQGGWNIIRVDDIRPYAVPPMQDILPQLTEAAAKKNLNAYIQSLISKAQIVK